MSSCKIQTHRGGSRRTSDASPEKSASIVPKRRIIATGVTLTALCLHFLMILLYTMPINPVSVRLHSPISQYIEPLFYQNWQLFAPEPLDSAQGLLLRIRVKDGTNITKTTEFVDITSPKISSLQATRFFPRLRNRIVSSVLGTINYRHPILLRLDALDGETAPCEPHFETVDPTGRTPEYECDTGATDLFTAPVREVMRSFARAELPYVAAELLKTEAFPSNRSTRIEAQLRIVYGEAVPFSRRNDSSYISYPTITDSPWLQILPR